MTEYQIREFQQEDMDTVLSAYESSSSRKQGIACVIDRGKKQTPQGSTLRLVAGIPAIAFLEVIDRSMTYYKPRCIPGVCDAMLFVARDYQNCGIGSALYDRMVLFARERCANTIRCSFYSYDPHFSAPSFFLKRGFTFDTKRHVMILDVSTYDPGLFSPSLHALRENNITIFRYEDTYDNRMRLYNLLHTLNNISEQLSFEQWSSLEMDTIDWKEDVLMLAASEDGQWIGTSNAILHNAEKGIASFPFTAVLPMYRGRGVATALAIKVLEILKQRGLQNAFAFTQVENVPILTVTKNIGFYRGAVQHVYRKNMSDSSL